MLETERRLRAALEENVQLKASKKKASVAIQATENDKKSAEAGLKMAERQINEWSEKCDREIEHSNKLREDISTLNVELNEARTAAQKTEDEAQSYYDQGFDEAASSLKSQLEEECNKHFVQGWRTALDRAGVHDAFELYDLGPRRRLFRPESPEQFEEARANEGQMDFEAKDEHIPVVDVQEGVDNSDGEGTLDVIS